MLPANPGNSINICFALLMQFHAEPDFLRSSISPAAHPAVIGFLERYRELFLVSTEETRKIFNKFLKHRASILK